MIVSIARVSPRGAVPFHALVIKNATEQQANEIAQDFCKTNLPTAEYQLHAEKLSVTILDGSCWDYKTPAAATSAFTVGDQVETYCDSRAIGGVPFAHQNYGVVTKITPCFVIVTNEFGNKQRHYPSGRATGTDVLTPTMIRKVDSKNDAFARRTKQ